MSKLLDTKYLSFPLRIDKTGARTSGRAAHVREQIEQVLFTNPNERIFRPEFGAGAKMLVFEPNASALWEVTRKRLLASLSEALQGEVDPKTLRVEVNGQEEKLKVIVSYALATIGYEEQHEFLLGGS